MPTFYSRFERALRKAATTEAAGRLQGETPVVVADIATPATTRTAPAKFELFGPGDVQGLAPAAITRRFPAPNCSDAEVTKMALVEFADHDLPWRYTPRIAAAELRPWIVLVVGQRADGDILLRPDGRVTLGLVAQNHHKLKDSADWAHVQEVGAQKIGRIVAPPRLAPGALPGNVDYLADTEYVACLVPAFTTTGDDSWNGIAPVTCDLYDRWVFRTGPEGDFPELASKLHKADLAAIEQAGGRPFGRADVSYRARTSPVKTTILPTAGALKLPPTAAVDPADASPAPDVAQEVAALSVRIPTPDGRGVVTAPRYHEAFADANALTLPTGGWIDALKSDPRHRGAAGIGVWNAIAWQDRIAEAAAVKAGDLATARDRIRHVAFGVELSRSLWRRRLPADPAARLAVLAPALGRLATSTGASVLDTIAGRTPGLTRALFSSAARRVLRPGPARAALTATGRAPLAAVIAAANQCPDRPDAAAIRRAHNDPARTLRQLVVDAADGDRALAEAMLNALGDNPSPGRIAAALRALAPDDSGRPNRDAIERFLHGGDVPEADRTILEWSGWMGEHSHREPCRRIDIDVLSKVVADAIDPTVKRPPVVARVLSTLPGITHIGPVEIEPELDLPLWSFLSERSPDWMLPGVGDLVDGDVVGLSTNPTFVEALLVGANHQATAELRWRNMPLVTCWSPLRKFWQRKAKDVDIVPIKTWPGTAALGTPALVPPLRTAEAVVVFRTPLFRRYPATVVYLYPAAQGWTRPDKTIDPTPLRVLPTFTGTIGTDVTFFGFPVKPEALATHWVVLEEPPAGYRFYQKTMTAADAGAPANGASNFAFQRFAVPVRVFIGKLVEGTA
ncbi:hypothetical protein QTH97_33490 [Variovorax sp. J22R24]|uniref:hypothetical protein n=1 Tax=Variovorax gracilis TaxID=3053502 RepID=UPI002576B501|nr:hypothetical protein [Variovorax sp. J22R24]MDM0109868.1 hypothetical protein [Variovorax sp. J22R24]